MMTKRMEALALALLLFIAGAEQRSNAAYAETKAQTTVRALFLNVGKADAALFSLDGKWYMVDTGTKDSADAMLRTLHDYGVTSLDGVMITHTDKDHVGGLKALLKSDIPVAVLYAPTFSVADIADHPVANAAEKYGIKLQWLNAGDTVTVDDDIRFSVLGPLHRDQETENNNSLVLRLETQQGDMLLTGDMETAEETELLAAGAVKPAAVLKVGHHGAEDASGEAFLYTVKPQVAVISTDPDEDENTPDPKVMKRLWNIGAEVYGTYQADCCVEVILNHGDAMGRLVNHAEE